MKGVELLVRSVSGSRGVCSLSLRFLGLSQRASFPGTREEERPGSPLRESKGVPSVVLLLVCWVEGFFLWLVRDVFCFGGC